MAMEAVSRLASIEGGATIFGPTLDALLRDLAPRLRSRPDLAALVEDWPMDSPTEPQDAELLFDRLMSLRASLPPPPLPAGRTPGSPLRAVGGAMLGGMAGLPLGFLLAYLVQMEVIPTGLGASDAAVWTIIGAIVVAAACLGAWQGARPSRLGHALLRGLGGFLLGALLGGLVSGVLAGVIGGLAGISQREGAFAMAVIFALMPLGGFICGTGTGIWMARRAWRRW